MINKSKKKRAALKKVEAQKHKLEEERFKKIKESSPSVEDYLSKPIGVPKTSPIVLEFYRALKNQKVFGAFCNGRTIRDLTREEKVDALRSHEFLEIGDIVVNPYEDSEFIKRIKVLKRMVTLDACKHRNHGYKYLSLGKAFECYAKEYFKNKALNVKHSVLYYQFVCGTITTIIGLIMIYGLIYYFGGGVVLIVISLITIVYFCIGIYKLFTLTLKI